MTPAERQARSRAMARRRKKRRQRRMILGTGLLLLLVIIGAIIFGVVSSKKSAQRNALLEAGIASLEAGNYDEAITSFNQALEDSGDKTGKFEINVLSYLGEAQYKKGDYQAAVLTYERLISADKENEQYKQMACYSQMELGNYEAALAYGLADAEIYNRMALDAIEKEDYESALEYIDKGTAVVGADAQVIQDLEFNRAVVYERKSDYERALELFEAYLDQYGSDETVEREIEFLKTRVGGTDAAGGADAGESSSGESASGESASAAAESEAATAQGE